jgi:hypothetical protein
MSSDGYFVNFFSGVGARVLAAGVIAVGGYSANSYIRPTVVNNYLVIVAPGTEVTQEQLEGILPEVDSSNSRVIDLRGNQSGLQDLIDLKELEVGRNE